VAEGLSKMYLVGGERTRYPTLRDKIAGTLAAPMRRFRGTPGLSSPTEFWAMRDLSFEVRAGDRLGFIGRNGAGKTTILKILSRITDPTHGWADVRGRVGSLLEVGTGFHPELTGRENIELNGAILGMKRSDIRKRFDEIVSFAEVERFLDTPVKHYSSGMYVRLAFAVAAHLEPDILMVDEVLAVGDAEFQKKCLGRMGEVAREGRTVLFVSHNMAVIQAFCDRCLVINQGKVVEDAPTDHAVATYLQSLERTSSVSLLEREDRRAEAWRQVQLAAIEVAGPGGGALATGSPARFTFHFEGLEPNLSCEFVVFDQLGLPIARFDSSVSSPEDSATAREPSAVCEIDELPLLPGRYRIDVTVYAGGHLQDGLDGAATFDVEQGTMRGRPSALPEAGASIFIAHRWNLPRSR
jgi:lipopolysaccharide transport system ATP-binding protein